MLLNSQGAIGPNCQHTSSNHWEIALNSHLKHMQWFWGITFKHKKIAFHDHLLNSSRLRKKCLFKISHICCFIVHSDSDIQKKTARLHLRRLTLTRCWKSSNYLYKTSHRLLSTRESFCFAKWKAHIRHNPPFGSMNSRSEVVKKTLNFFKVDKFRNGSQLNYVRWIRNENLTMAPY